MSRSFQRIGILGGTFDPIHVGHLLVAEQVSEQLALDKMLFVPAFHPPHKRSAIISSYRIRRAMVQLAIQDNVRFALSDIEQQHKGLSYSVLTVEALRRQHPDTQIFFIIGRDIVQDLKNWYYPGRLSELATIIVVPRPMQLLGRGRVRKNMHIVPVTPINISSSEIRQRVREGRSIRYLVPAAVESYIFKHNLYR